MSQVALVAAIQDGRLGVVVQIRGPVLMKRDDVVHEDVTADFIRLVQSVGPTLTADDA